MSDTRAPEPGRRAVRIGQDVGGGIFLLLIAAAALWGSWSLSFGQLSGVGPGLMPRVTAILVAVMGIGMIIYGLAAGSDPMPRWSIRGPLFVLGAILVFALTIRPFGLAFAGLVALLLASFGDRDTRAQTVMARMVTHPLMPNVTRR